MFYTRGIFNDHITQKVRDIFNKKPEVVEESFDDHRELGKKGRIKFKKNPSVGEYIEFYDKNGNKQYGQVNKYTKNGDHIHINQHGKETHKLQVIKEDSTEEIDEAVRVDYKKVGDTHYHRKDKGTWNPLPKHIEVKKVGNEVHVRKNKGTWVPQKHATFMEEVETNEDEQLDEGYKVGDMVNVTNPKAKPRYKIIGKTKTHYHLEKPNGDKMHLPKTRIARVNKERFDSLKAKVAPERLKGSDIPVKEEVELSEGFGVYRKGGSIGEKHSSPHGTLVKTHDNEEDAKKHAKRMNSNLSPGEKTYYGIKYHVKPIKESIEAIDEISKKTLGSYVNKAAHDIDNKAYLSGKEVAAKDYGKAFKYDNKTQKRKAGIKKAVNKLTKEEIEMIEKFLSSNEE